MVVDIPPDNKIYNLGRVNSTLYIYNTNNPPAQVTNYGITIINVLHQQAQIQPGYSDSFQPAGNVVYVQNSGPSKLQALYVEAALSPEAAGWKTVSALPAESTARPGQRP